MADVFTSYQHLLPPLSLTQAKAVRDIIDCRTARMGGHVRQCQNCGEEEISYNSCRNRHCPRCQFLARARWLEARESELLPVSYFHVVFTVPHVLNPLMLCNPKALYGLLFKTVSATLQEVAGRKMNDANLGFVAVLHTWGQNLMHHPHLHLIVPGGGLSPDKSKWVPTSQHYLLPLKVLSQVFRGKFLSALEQMQSELEFPGSIERLRNPGRYKNLLREAAAKDWVVYAKRPFAGPKQVLNYLGNYTHRIAISNYRLIKIQDDHVFFRYRDYRDGGTTKIMRLHAREFMRRFLRHVLPQRFVRIRHMGFLGSRFKRRNLAQVKALIGAAPDSKSEQKHSSATDDWIQWLKQKTGVDLTCCRRCKSGVMVKTRTIERMPWVKRHSLWQRSRSTGYSSLHGHLAPELDTS